MTDLFSPMEKECKGCNKLKTCDDFYVDLKRKDSLGYLCKKCQCSKSKSSRLKKLTEYRLKAKKYNERNKDKSLKRSSDFYYSKRGRALTLYGGCKRRSKEKGWKFEMSKEDFINLLESEECAVTGVRFDYKKPSGTMKNPYSPSIDRIDSSLPYQTGNVRIVIWQYNLMKGELSDDELYRLCEKVVSRK